MRRNACESTRESQCKQALANALKTGHTVGIQIKCFNFLWIKSLKKKKKSKLSNELPKATQ